MGILVLHDSPPTGRLQQDISVERQYRCRAEYHTLMEQQPGCGRVPVLLRPDRRQPVQPYLEHCPAPPLAFPTRTSTTYYWQVRAVNNVGTTDADNQAWGSFTTTPSLAAGLTEIEAFVRTNKLGKYSLGDGQSLRKVIWA